MTLLKNQFLLILILALFATCAKQIAIEHEGFPVQEEDNIREHLFRHLIQIDEEMPSQAEGSARPWTYCLEISSTIEEDGIAPTPEFMNRFEPGVRAEPKGKCEPESERIHKIASVRWITRNKVEVWSQSWATKRETGYTCLHAVEYSDGVWNVQKECLDGLINN